VREGAEDDGVNPRPTAERRTTSANPSIKLSLTFLRRTPWARKKVDELYIAMVTAQMLSLEKPQPEQS